MQEKADYLYAKGRDPKMSGLQGKNDYFRTT